MATTVVQEEGTRPGSLFFHIEDSLYYHRSFVGQTTTYFKCVRRARGCHGHAVLDEKGFRHSGQHNHGPDLLYPTEMALRRRILAHEDLIHYLPWELQQIISDESRPFPVEVIRRVQMEQMGILMRRPRMRNLFIPAHLRQICKVLL